jgi:hypothetical protein
MAGSKVKTSLYRIFWHPVLTMNGTALTSRVSPQHQGGAHLKSAAVFAETEEIREVVRRLWEGSSEERQELIDKVENSSSF